MLPVKHAKHDGPPAPAAPASFPIAAKARVRKGSAAGLFVLALGLAIAIVLFATGPRTGAAAASPADATATPAPPASASSATSATEALSGTTGAPGTPGTPGIEEGLAGAQAGPQDEVSPIPAPEAPPLVFGVSGYVVCRPTVEEARREVARITDVKASSRGYANYEQWLAGTNLEQRVSLEDYSVSNRGLRSGLVGTPEDIAKRLDAFERAGVDLTLLQFSPQREEMEAFASEVIPLLGSRHRSSVA